MNADQRRGDRAVDPFARLPHQPLDLEPLRHRLVGDGVVARMQRLRHRAPRSHPLGIVGMRREPRLDIAATLRRQFVVDIGVQLVFGDGNLWVGHGRCLSRSLSGRSLSIENHFSASLPSAPAGEAGTKASRPNYALSNTTSCIMSAIISHVRHHFTRRSAGRSPSSEALTWARARARRDITVPIGTPWMSATSR